jgi:hypothetical protein
MGAGTRILAGCGCLAVATAVALVAGMGLGVFWVKDRAKELVGDLDSLTSVTREIHAWETEANAHPYEPPPHGIVPEDRLLTFIEVRRRVHAVYETHKAELEKLAHDREGGPPLDAKRILAMGGRTAVMFSDLRLAQVKALAELGMSEREYRAIQLAVYKAWGAARTQSETGHTPAEAVSATAREVRKGVRNGVDSAREAGVPGSARVDDADVRRIEEAVSKAGEKGAQALAVPPENVALFEKHRKEIDRFAMTGLAFLGL